MMSIFKSLFGTKTETQTETRTETRTERGSRYEYCIIPLNDEGFFDFKGLSDSVNLAGAIDRGTISNRMIEKISSFIDIESVYEYKFNRGQRPVNYLRVV